MNIGEANHFFQLMRSMETEADELQRERGLQAAEALTIKARKALDAGPLPVEINGLVLGLHEAVDTAAFDGYDVALGERHVVTVTPKGGVL